MKTESPQNPDAFAGAGIGTAGVRRSLILLAFVGLVAALSSQAATVVVVAAPPPPVTFCLKDNSTGNLLQWNTTGAYTFTRCSDGFTLTGTGVAKLVNGIQTLTDFKTDRRLSAGFNTGQLTGSATIYRKVAAGVWQTFRIVDTNPAAVCACP